MPVAALTCDLTVNLISHHLAVGLGQQPPRGDLTNNFTVDPVVDKIDREVLDGDIGGQIIDEWLDQRRGRW